jgi:signal transduction histidine kinase
MRIGKASKARRANTLFEKMWHPMLALMLATFLVHAFLVTATLQLGSEAQTQRRLTRIAEHWRTQPVLTAALALDPVTVLYPRYDALPADVRRLLHADQRGMFELGPRAQDYFVLVIETVRGGTLYVVEFHSEVKPGETIEHQVFIWYLSGMVPFCALLLWACKRLTARVSSPIRDVGRQVTERPADSLQPLALPAGSPSELETLVVQINAALKRTADVIDRERSFARFASHELRTPAAVVQAAMERVEARSTPEQVPALSRAHRGLRDMHALIDTFLQLSTESGPTRNSGSVLIDRKWVESLVCQVSGGHLDGRFRIAIQDVLLLDAPETMAHVLLANLLKNALFHGGPGAIVVLVQYDGMEVRNGLAAQPSQPGHGLGCQIAHRICNRLGWTFSLEFTPDGATARVQLPVYPRCGVLGLQAPSS